MPLSRRALVAAVLPFALALAPVARADSAKKTAPVEAKSHAQDEAALRKILAEQTDAWNRGDAEAWCAPFTSDAVFINIVGTVLNGREEMTRRHAFIFAGMFKGSRSQVTVERVAFLTNDVAVVDTEHGVTGYNGLPPGVQPTEPGVLKTRLRYVFLRSAGKWLIAAAQNTDEKPAPPSRPTAPGVK